MRRALIVANKWWEADPLVDVLSSAASTPSTVTFKADSSTAGMRGFIETARGRVEIWCVQDLMSPAKSGSSSEEKVRVLQPLLGNPDIVLVVAFGTAATPGEQSLNGSVIVGTKTFCHDPYVADTSSHWIPSALDKIVDSPLNTAQFQAITADPLKQEACARLLPVPLNQDPKPAINTNYDYVALADINVTNFHDYALADPQVVLAFERLGAPEPIGSLETTHAVIAACTTAPFMFVSGITDRIGYFDSEVIPAPYGQNFVAAHNAGLAVSFMIPQIAATMLAVR